MAIGVINQLSYLGGPTLYEWVVVHCDVWFRESPWISLVQKWFSNENCGKFQRRPFLFQNHYVLYSYHDARQTTQSSVVFRVKTNVFGCLNRNTLLCWSNHLFGWNRTCLVGKNVLIQFNIRRVESHTFIHSQGFSWWNPGNAIPSTAMFL
jgi:hypothetical protein